MTVSVTSKVDVWKATYAAAYVAEHYARHRRTGDELVLLGGGHPAGNEECDSVAEDAAAIADNATEAFERLFNNSNAEK